MLCKPKPSALRRRVRRILLRALIVLILLSAFLELAVKSQLADAITVRMKALSQRAINAAVTEYLSGDPTAGESLTCPHYGDSGAVVSITSDPASVNRLKAAVCTLAQDKIEALCADDGLSVPLGSFSGFVFFANVGPDIRLDIVSRCTVTCSLRNTFESAGVNQTLHHIRLVVEAEIVICNPFRIAPIHTSADFEIAQTVIVGSVPNYACGSLWQ